MKKHFESVIIVVVLVIVVLGVILLSNFLTPKFIEEITFDDYKSEVKDLEKGYLYVGDDSNIDILTTFAKEERITIYYLKSSSLTENQHKELSSNNKKNQLITWNEEKRYKYDGSFSSYKFKKNLIDNKIIDNSIIEVNVNEYKDLVKNKDTKFMFIGSATCGYCTKYAPELKKVASKYSDFRIYYIDIANIVTQDDYDTLTNTDKYLSENNWGTPLSLLYKGGKRVGEISGYISADEVIEVLKEKDIIK